MPKLPVDWFLVGIAGAIALAWVAPGPGADGGWMHPELVTKLGVALIFLLHGLGLSFGALRAGAARWRLHLVVQAATYAAFPLLTLLVVGLAGGAIAPDLRLGFYYLGALPSTVSSSVAMTAAARGNVAAAIFNATLSSLLGVLLTPLLIGWMMAEAGGTGGGHPLPFGKVVLDLILWLVLPLVVGQALRPWLGGWAARHKRGTSKVDRGTILLLVYTSFCDSVQQGIWTREGSGVVAAVLGSAAILAVMLVGVNLACRGLGFPSEDRTAAVFCGSKKTLASGVPMAHLIFGSSPSLGVILLPIMVYHPLQLVVCGALAAQRGRRAEGVDRHSPPANASTR